MGTEPLSVETLSGEYWQNTSGLKGKIFKLCASMYREGGDGLKLGFMICSGSAYAVCDIREEDETSRDENVESKLRLKPSRREYT